MELGETLKGKLKPLGDFPLVLSQVLPSLLHPPRVFCFFLPLPPPWGPRGLLSPEWHPRLCQGSRGRRPQPDFGDPCAAASAGRGARGASRELLPHPLPIQAEHPEHPEHPQHPERPFCATVPLPVMCQTCLRCLRSRAGSYQPLALSQNPSAERLLSPNKLINPCNPPEAAVPAQIRQLRASRDLPEPGKDGMGLSRLFLASAGRGDGTLTELGLSSLSLHPLEGFGTGQAGAPVLGLSHGTQLALPKPPRSIPGLSEPLKAPPSLLQPRVHTLEVFNLPRDEQGGGKRGLIPCFCRLVSVSLRGVADP